MRFRTLLAAALVAASPATAQYWGERALEKSFEQTEFFFTPSYLNPYGIGSFTGATPGLLDDPLLEFIVNPARIGLDSLRWGYLYTDFRTARTVAEEPAYYPHPLYDGARTLDAIYPYPRFYVESRRELEPVFSGAFFGKPLPGVADGLLAGLTYQLVLQDDKYYGIPQDIYRTVAGLDYSGERAAAADALPVVDRYSGTDNISQEGHFLNVFARYALPFGLDLAARLGRVTFDREGSLGSSNLWDGYQQSTSLWSNMEARDQQYGHWDISGGVRFHATPGLSVGAMAGYLRGDAVQHLSRGDSSYYAYSYDAGSSYYMRSGSTGQNWRHEGRTRYWGLDLTGRPSREATVTLIYRREASDVDIGLGSAIMDTSDSRYSWTGSEGTVVSYSESYLNDRRAGAGVRERTVDRLTGSVRWEISERVRLSLGAVVEWQSTTTATTEEVGLESRSAYWSTSGSWDYRHARSERKWLDWTFTAHRRSFRIPVFVTITASEVIDILLGINRDMARWETSDVTLARFAYRETTENGTTDRKENFAERTTLPAETVTDVRTAFLAGLTVNVTRAFALRLLMVPNFRDTYDGTELQELQWWIGLNLTP